MLLRSVSLPMIQHEGVEYGLMLIDKIIKKNRLLLKFKSLFP